MCRKKRCAPAQPRLTRQGRCLQIATNPPQVLTLRIRLPCTVVAVQAGFQPVPIGTGVVSSIALTSIPNPA
jgi:hypothetical protein